MARDHKGNNIVPITLKDSEKALLRVALNYQHESNAQQERVTDLIYEVATKGTVEKYRMLTSFIDWLYEHIYQED